MSGENKKQSPTELTCNNRPGSSYAYKGKSLNFLQEHQPSIKSQLVSLSCSSWQKVTMMELVAGENERKTMLDSFYLFIF